MRFRFPYPPLQVFALIAVVVFATAHSVLTQRQVAEGPNAHGATTWVLSMFAITVVLAMFVAIVLLHRARLALTITDEALVLERLHWRAGSRRLEIPLERVTRVRVRPDTRGHWHVHLESHDQARRLRLEHAVGPDGARVARITNKQAAAEHPLVVALVERLGERVAVG